MFMAERQPSTTSPSGGGTCGKQYKAVHVHGWINVGISRHQLQYASPSTTSPSGGGTCGKRAEESSNKPIEREHLRQAVKKDVCG
jgi:hypothetical protein